MENDSQDSRTTLSFKYMVHPSSISRNYREQSNLLKVEPKRSMLTNLSSPILKTTKRDSTAETIAKMELSNLRVVFAKLLC